MIQFTPFDSLEEEARALSLLTAAQKEDYRRRQFAYRIEQRRLHDQAQAQALKKEQEQKVSTAKKRQASNRAAHIAKCQETRSNRTSK